MIAFAAKLRLKIVDRMFAWAMMKGSLAILNITIFIFLFVGL